MRNPEEEEDQHAALELVEALGAMEIMEALFQIGHTWMEFMVLMEALDCPTVEIIEGLASITEKEEEEVVLWLEASSLQQEQATMVNREAPWAEMVKVVEVD